MTKSEFLEKLNLIINKIYQSMREDRRSKYENRRKNNKKHRLRNPKAVERMKYSEDAHQLGTVLKLEKDSVPSSYYGSSVSDLKPNIRDVEEVPLVKDDGLNGAGTVYSLNKKKRWEWFSAVQNVVEYDPDVEESEMRVGMVERSVNGVDKYFRNGTRCKEIDCFYGRINYSYGWNRETGVYSYNIVNPKIEKPPDEYEVVKGRKGKIVRKVKTIHPVKTIYSGGKMVRVKERVQYKKTGKDAYYENSDVLYVFSKKPENELKKFSPNNDGLWKEQPHRNKKKLVQDNFGKLDKRNRHDY